MFLLDTDIWTHLQRGTPRVVQAMRLSMAFGVKLSLPLSKFTFVADLTQMKVANPAELMRAQANLTRDLDALQETEVVANR